MTLELKVLLQVTPIGLMSGEGGSWQWQSVWRTIILQTRRLGMTRVFVTNSLMRFIFQDHTPVTYVPFTRPIL